MRIRHVLATTAVGAALSFGALAVPAQAAAIDADVATTAAPSNTDQTEGEASIQSAYHFWASYYSLADCTAAGYHVIQSNPSRYLKATCSHGSNGKYNLYILI
ncbi:hypothetical protein [Streptomyces violaceusniger]|uniref:Secreted protein n=1 Tax=Streptomyces violaceusniger (strain Tu 4113) TaxID=653045 RepID=G2NWK4_STRV4|nr:hypothetical protein [Streptomyces violaceusniger]AEM86961.1 hypothetical protein Strvi_7620 [Streptomyces violaceusniger Tu 4113]